jgi:hypothetical protein
LKGGLQPTEDDHGNPIHGLLIKLLTLKKAIQSSWTFAPKWFFMEGLKVLEKQNIKKHFIIAPCNYHERLKVLKLHFCEKSI